jgi:hypothetical protein
MLFLLLIGVAGWLVYRGAMADDPPAAEVVDVLPEPVDFVVKMRVRRAIEAWENQTTGRRRPSMVELSVEVNAIRRRLSGDGRHDDASLTQTMVRAAVELGHRPDQAQHLIGKILAAAGPAQPGPGGSQRRGGGDADGVDAPELPVPGMQRSVGGRN